MIVLGPATDESSLYARIRRLCKTLPTSPDAYTGDAILKAYINDELKLVASESRSIKKSNAGSEPSTTQGTRLYAFPDDAMEMVDVYCGVTNALIRLQYRSTENLYQTYGPGYTSRQGQPLYYYIDYNSTTNKYQVGLAMVPGSSSYKLQYWYILNPGTLSSDSDVAQIDDRLNWCLCYRVAAKIMHDKRDPAFEQIYSAKAQELMQKYLDSGRKSREPLEALNTSKPSNRWIT